MPDYHTIYQSRAADYELLVSREDYQGNLPRALKAIRPLDDCQVVELGAGTGRVTRLLAPRVKSIIAFDISAHMLSVAATTLAETGYTNWQLGVADNRVLPLQACVADIALVGWSLGHFVSWYGSHWRDEIGKSLAEMRRILHPDGVCIIIETLGTGATTPTPPTPGLADYYAWLENDRSFNRQAIRTDYLFESLAEAEQLTRFFFGEEMAERVVHEQHLILPECTGIWWS